ncbi:hypothetical protein B7988_14590 [Fibrobacter sp. UWB1]|uniref:FISUMP domain-containing protein n=1 Tax=Fibrobacter sp. UWB1 TaxID=1964355 RepID=UPI000B75CC5E|nr:FISUMP domain-containing protein [Fibrobacter sp. UWB1]OWV23486.1 hypothetical protein B7988_14590 [Fibrobacter sp. UWB1]
MKIFKSVLALSVLLTMLVACGGDSSSSSVSPDPRPCEDQNEDCDDTSSSSGEVSKNSSSSQKNSNKEKSSSSVEKSKSSSSSKKDENSSSSEDKAKESSSSVKPSSSDAKSSSSEETKTSSSSGVFDVNAPCTYGDVYVEEVDGEKRAYICYEDGWKRYIPKSSSSSVAKSSSSSSIRGYEALPYVPFKSSLSYGEFTDTRDGKKYATIDIDNKYGPDSVRLAFTVFAQNLKYHDKMVLGTEEQDDDAKVEMYCYKDSVEYCNDWWGGLYQWAELMDLPYECNNKSCAELVDPDGDGFHQGICPDGWHVMTRKEMLAASYTTGGSKYLDDRMSTLASEISYANGFGSNTSGMSFLAAGYRNGEKKLFDFLSEVALVAFAEENALIELNSRVGGVSNVTSLESTTPKIDGVSVRCVKDY